MVYDPIAQKWNGNNEELEQFEKQITLIRAKPKLITQNDNHLDNNYGQMVFDPEEMKWKGNEEDLDLFDGIDEFEIGVGNILLIENTGRCDLDKKMLDAFHKREIAHKLLMGKWYPRVNGNLKGMARDTSKLHLYDIKRNKE
jgi:predicted Holliday junction resolvase-like endonuclease